ncbi:uncharacterized protein AB675_2811 [Cyphellophora attinorum]|uniref:Uncharacterized protein n=1 Tax=Cyphellophora attinorum TaxID=1664694 RepID=A0A0N1HAJ4_9EURO|nr:uncharacterized protein AB675_2811 [Phialophora attinorum]KPI45013.1 hypothetical protein AB675_2811 [Phialophora attinorum]
MKYLPRALLTPPTVNFAAPDPAAHPAIGALDAYQINRRKWLYQLRRQTRSLVLLFATLETVWRGSANIVSGKSYNAEIDHGFVYSIGYFLSWVFSCFFAVIYASLFEWWLPLPSAQPAAGLRDDASHSTAQAFGEWLQKADMIILPVAIGMTLAVWGGLVVMALLDVGNTRLKYTSKFRSVLIVLTSVAWTLGFGYYSLELLSRYGFSNGDDMVPLARVRWEMDAWVLTPIAVNIGMAIGTAFVGRFERKRIAVVDARNHVEEQLMGQAVLDEKA